MANNVIPEEMAHYEPFHLDLHCIQKYLSWSTGLQGFNVVFNQFMPCSTKKGHWQIV